MSISDKLQTLINGKTELVNTINEKAGTALTVSSPWSDLKDSINGLSSGGGEDRLKKLLDATKSAGFLFYNYSGTSVDDLIKYDDTTNVTNMNKMFYNCKELTTIPLLNTSQVTNMSDMFNSSPKLTTIPLLNTSKVTDMSHMFNNCANLTTVPLLDTSQVTNMSSMFCYCRKLTTVPLLDTSEVTNMKVMFQDCNALTKVIIYNSTKVPPLYTNSFNNCDHFHGTVDVTYNPEGLKDGRIYVPDDMVESFKTATNWSVFADQILPLSELPTEE